MTASPVILQQQRQTMEMAAKKGNGAPLTDLDMAAVLLLIVAIAAVIVFCARARR